MSGRYNLRATKQRVDPPPAPGKPKGRKAKSPPKRIKVIESEEDEAPEAVIVVSSEESSALESSKEESSESDSSAAESSEPIIESDSSSDYPDDSEDSTQAPRQLSAFDQEELLRAISLSMKQLENNEARNLRAQQDAEYQEALEQDRATERRQEEREQAERAEEEKQQERIRYWQPFESTLGTAPAEQATHQLALCGPQGQRMRCAFLPTAPLSAVLAFAQSQFGQECASLQSDFPRRRFDDLSMALQDALPPSTLLRVCL
jgi:hypothetical protein